MLRFAVLLFCFFSFSLSAQNVNFTILTFNDFYEIVPNKDGLGGIAEMKTLLDRERQLSDHHVTTVNGDFIFPSLLSTLDQGVHRIELLNDLKIDMVVVGNHEFDLGPDILTKRIEESKFLWLGSNVLDLEQKPFTKHPETVILDVEGIKIGFMGLLTPETVELSSTDGKVIFTPLSATAKKMVAELKKQGAVVIVALTHLLMEEDRQLAKEVPEINLILGGHDHEPITWYEGKTFIHKSGMNAYYLCRIDLEIEKAEDGHVKIFPTWKMILNRKFEKDPYVAQKISEYESSFRKSSMEQIAVVESELDSRHSIVRTQETTMGNLVADSVRFSCDADIAIISSGIIRGDRLYKAGTILTLEDILSEFPFSNSNVCVEMTGSDILEALENGVSQYDGKAGRFPQVSGMQFKFDMNQNPGNRISDAYINSKPLEKDALYKVATVDYMWKGGDGYTSFNKGKLLIGPMQSISMISSLVDYIKEKETINMQLEDRMICIKCRKGLDGMSEK